VSHAVFRIYHPLTISRNCPEKVLHALKQELGSSVVVLKSPTVKDPVITVTYIPSPPSFTIRSILKTLGSVNDSFRISVYHPPSVEERSHIMRQKDQRDYLTRALFTTLIAIPTFIIGVVFATLVHDDNPTKQFFLGPIWAGNVSRAEWALFILATPVMFYSASIFHTRSLKELKALWRPGSHAPLLRRFVRFGSMNLLVSSAVSLAYFASIALLALAAVHGRSREGNGDFTTYFDSVVFIAMFLLFGKTPLNWCLSYNHV
jgi:P-type Cu+ transporter